MRLKETCSVRLRDLEWTSRHLNFISMISIYSYVQEKEIQPGLDPGLVRCYSEYESDLGYWVRSNCWWRSGRGDTELLELRHWSRGWRCTYTGVHEPPKAAKERVTHGEGACNSRVPVSAMKIQICSSNDFHIWKAEAHLDVAWCHTVQVI